MSRIDESKDFIPVRIAVLTVSDSRSLEEDRSGQVLVDRLTEAGHAPLPRSFTATQAPAEWRALCTLLDGIDPASPRAARICADARRAFRIFALAAQAPPAASPPRQAPPRPAQTRKDLLLG